MQNINTPAFMPQKRYFQLARSRLINIRQLQNSHAAESYALQLEASLPSEEELGAAPLEDGWSQIRTAIGNAADGECQQMSTEKKAAWARLLQTRTRANK